MSQAPQREVLLRRLGSVWAEIQMRRFLRIDARENYSPAESYPGWWSWDAMRKYFCILTGGCKWGEPYTDTILGGQGLVVACKKCGNVWANWEQCQTITFTTASTTATNTTYRWHV